MTITTLPDTPVGRQAGWILDRLGSQMKDEEISERFDASFLEAVTAIRVQTAMEKWKVHLPLTISKAIGDDFRLQVLLDGALGPQSLNLAVSTVEPHQIASLNLQYAGPTIGEALREAPARRDTAALIEEQFGAFASRLRGKRAGVAVGVLFENETTVSAFGAASQDSLFEIGSLTKPITATLLAELVASKEVALDDPVERYLPAGIGMPPTGADGPITLLELATHSSGLPRIPANIDIPDMSDPYTTFTTDALFEGLAASPLEDRGKVVYSNLGYSLLGQVLSRAVGKSYEDLVTSRVFEPLGMVDATLGPNPATNERRIPGYKKGDVVPYWGMTAIQPAGGVVASVRDVLAFGAAHASANAGSPLAVTQIPRLPQEGDAHIGLAWNIEGTQHGDVHWHIGGTGGFIAFLGFHRGSGTALAALTNTSDKNGPGVPAATVLGSLIGAAHR